MKTPIIIFIFALLIITVFASKSAPIPSPTPIPAATPIPTSIPVPLDRTKDRVTKKTFGMYITPQNSPVQPEKFTGFHTGTDFEIFSEELNADVVVRAICPGKLLVREYASGYGGVAVQSCDLNNQSVTVIYGHLNLASIQPTINSEIHLGDIIGDLGAAYSRQTDGERKHLHLGIHKGTEINILGYVSIQSQLSSWLDPVEVLPLFD